MHWIKRVLAALILVAIGFMTGTVREQLAAQKAPSRSSARTAPVRLSAQVIETSDSPLAAGTPPAGSASSSIYFNHSDIAPKYVIGSTVIYDGKKDGKNYDIHLSIRDKQHMPYAVGKHTFDTDIYYVVDGSCTYVTGGTMIEPKVLNPGQTKGEIIEGGDTYQLSKGDMLIIPKGVPHWFKDIQSDFRYVVVKVR